MLSYCAVLVGSVWIACLGTPQVVYQTTVTGDVPFVGGQFLGIDIPAGSQATVRFTYVLSYGDGFASTVNGKFSQSIFNDPFPPSIGDIEVVVNGLSIDPGPFSDMSGEVILRGVGSPDVSSFFLLPNFTNGASVSFSATDNGANVIGVEVLERVASGNGLPTSEELNRYNDLVGQTLPNGIPLLGGGLSLGATFRTLSIETRVLSDLDDSGTTELSDLIMFVEALDRGEPSADVDGSSTVDFFDLIAFARLYDAVQ